MKEKALLALGLNRKESQIYLANLRIGYSLVQDIAKNAKMNRTSAYDLLDSLEKKGFVSHTISSGKKYYQATNPQNLFNLLKEKESLVKQALPELNAIKESVTKKPPNIEVYMGKNGLKTIFEDILQNSKYFDCIASKKHLFELFKFYFPHFVKRRVKQRIKVRIISNEQPYDKKAPYKLINNNLKTATWLYNNKIAMVSLEEKQPIGIIIDEKNFFDTQKLMFDLLWENL